MTNNNNKNGITFVGLTSFRDERKRFGIKKDDRRRHFYTIGKTGMGKSNLMENMAIQDIQNGNGIAYVDPHGEGAEKLLDFIPSDRIKDVVFFNPADLDFPIAFNVMEKVDFKYRHLVAGGLMAVFKKVWPDVWSARMEYILNNAILALLEYPDSTLLGVNRMLADPVYRAKVVEKITDPIVRSFWLTEYSRYTQRYEIEATAAIQNKVGQFVSNALIRNIIGQNKSTIDMRRIMDEGKILILDLSKGRIGEDNSRLLGALLITKLQLAAMSRVDIPEEERKDFYLYVDEFQNFATESFASILSEARKYRLSLIIGHQYISQMEDIVRDAVFGNVGTIATFRVGAEDAEFLEKEFMPEFTAQDLVNLPKYNVYLRLMIDGIASHPFSAYTLPPPLMAEKSNRDSIIAASRERYGVGRAFVEEKIVRWTEGDKPQASSAPQLPSQKPKDSMQKPASIPTNSQPGKVATGEQPILYNAICSNCGKDTKVIFPPDPQKPVYCKSCLKKMQNAKNAQRQDAAKTSTNVKPQEQKVPIISQPQKQAAQMPAESVYFSKSKGRKENVQNKKEEAVPLISRKKEINLSDLKKAIEESLQSKERQESHNHNEESTAKQNYARGTNSEPVKEEISKENNLSIKQNIESKSISVNADKFEEKGKEPVLPAQLSQPNESDSADNNDNNRKGAESEAANNLPLKQDLPGDDQDHEIEVIEENSKLKNDTKKNEKSRQQNSKKGVIEPGQKISL